MSPADVARHYGQGTGLVFDKPVLARHLIRAASEIDRQGAEIKRLSDLCDSYAEFIAENMLWREYSEWCAKLRDPAP